MQCLTCSHKNPATVSYCQRCGAKMALTADEISASLVEKAKGEIAQSTEYYARQALVFSAVVLLVMITLLVLSSGAPEDSYHIPSASNGAKYVSIEYPLTFELPKLQISIDVKRR